MTKATTEGRQLVLTVEGIDTPFRVDPLPAKRGKYLTEQFILVSLGQGTIQAGESIFIESFGPANYSRMSGLYVDEFDRDGAYLQTWGPDGTHTIDWAEAKFPDGFTPGKFLARDEILDEEPLDGEPIREEEGQSLALCAFYWQSIVGMEAVKAFIEEGEGTTGSLKALGLLRIRLGASLQQSLSSMATENSTQQATSSKTSDTGNLSATVRLPANKRSIGQNSAKSKRHQ